MISTGNHAYYWELSKDPFLSNAYRMAPKYTKERLGQALEACRNGMSLNESSIKYGVPKGTLHNKLKKKHEGVQGTPLVLPDEVEKRLKLIIDLFFC